MYIFYDTETTGLDRNFAQILQVALVFADDDFNILSMKKIECRRSPWSVPMPAAMLTTGFSPDDLKNNKLSHFELMSEVNDWARARHWPIIFSGYNTLGFDEGVLAQNFFQNLMHTDLTTAVNNLNGQSNSRLDIFQMVKAASVYMPGLLKLDILTPSGKPSLSLGNVARQNGVSLSEEDAHDAMNDIKATIGIARVIKKGAPELWEHMASLATADGVEDFISQNKVFSYTDISYGRTRSPVVTVADGFDGMSVVVDLSFDPAAYAGWSVDQLADELRKKDYGAPKPFWIFDTSSQPVVMPLSMADAVLPAGFDDALAATRADAVQADAVFRQNLAAAAKQVIGARRQPPAQAEEWIDTPLEPALQAQVDAWLHVFHGAGSWQKRRDAVDDFKQQFGGDFAATPRLAALAEFAERLVYEHAPEVLDVQRHEDIRQRIAARVMNPDLNAPYATIPKARRELEQIERERAAGSAKWAHVSDTQIRSLKLYYTAIEKECTSRAPDLPVAPDALIDAKPRSDAPKL